MTTAYAYDAANRIASITYPSGATVSYSRDTMGRIMAVAEQPNGGANTSVASNITYEPFGPYNGLTNGNGVAEARGFDQDYRLTGITDIGGSSTLQSLTYGYYPTNNVQTATNSVASGQNTGSANMSYGYGTGSDQLATLSMGGTVVQTIGYTADGRIASLNPGIQAPTGQYITSLSYNQDGRLTSVNAGAGTLASYIYDGFEQRLIKTVSGSYGQIYQYGQDGALLEETDASGAAQADYIYVNGRPIAVLNGSTLYYLHDDMLGTPQLATDGSQAVQWQASYDAFGEASVSGTVTQNLRLPGQYFDVESGWNHNGFRDYAPQLGRYVEPDPLGRLGSGNNLYLYVGNNPVGLSDPFGLCPKCTVDLGLAPFINALGSTADTIMGEEAPPSVVGKGQYQYGDTLGNPTGPSITIANLDSEAYLIASSMVNRGNQRGETLDEVVSRPNQYTGYEKEDNTARVKAALQSPAGSAECVMLNRALNALASAINDPGDYLNYRAQVIPKIGNQPAHVVRIEGIEWVGRSMFF